MQLKAPSDVLEKDESPFKIAICPNLVQAYNTIYLLNGYPVRTEKY